MKKKFFLMILVLMLVFAATASAWAASENEEMTITAAVESTGTMVAQYGDLFFENLPAALNEAGADNGVRGPVILIEDTNVSGTVTVPSGVTLLLPYRDGVTEASEHGAAENTSATYAWLNPAKYLNRTLTIEPGTVFNVEGELLIGGVRLRNAGGAMQGHTSGEYAQIINNGTINLTGTMEVHGLIQGNGTVNVKTGAAVYEPFVLLDFGGGSSTLVLYRNGNQFPFGQFICPNIKNTLNVSYDAEILGMAGVFANSKINEVSGISVVGGEDSLIQLTDTKSMFTRVFDSSQIIKPRLNGLGVSVEKAVITVSGGGQIGTMSLNLPGMGTVDSEKIYLGLPYNYDVVLESGTYELGKNGYFRIMPGARVEVAECATLNVKGRLMVYDGLHDTIGRVGCFYPNETELKNAGFSTSGNLVVNGTLNLASKSHFGGIVQTEGTSGKIVVASNVTLTNSNIKYGCEAGKAMLFFSTSENNPIYHNLSARVWDIESGAIKTLVAGETYEAVSGDIWDLTEYQEKRTGDSSVSTYPKTAAQAMQGSWGEEMYDVRFYTDSSKSTLFDHQRYTIGSGKAGKTPTSVPTKEPNANTHYIFKQWDNTNYLKTLNGDLDVYAIYTEGAHEFAVKSNETHHWKECGGCEYETAAVSHANVTRFNDEHHWTECQHCGYTDGTLTAHKMVEKTDGTDTWLECEGCRYSEGKKILLGDVDLDGDIDSDDLTVLARHVAGIVVLADKNSLDNADVTFDGNVNAEDLTRLAQYVAGIISSFDAA